MESLKLISRGVKYIQGRKVCCWNINKVSTFARNVSKNPETQQEFPLLHNEDDLGDFNLSDIQKNRALAIEHLASRLVALRIELFPGYMSEGIHRHGNKCLTLDCHSKGLRTFQIHLPLTVRKCSPRSCNTKSFVEQTSNSSPKLYEIFKEINLVQPCTLFNENRYSFQQLQALTL